MALTKSKQLENEVLSAITLLGDPSALMIGELIGKAEGTVHGVAQRLYKQGLIGYGTRLHKTANRTMNVRTFLLAPPIVLEEPASPVNPAPDVDLIKELEELRAWKNHVIELEPSLEKTPAELWAINEHRKLIKMSETEIRLYLANLYPLIAA